MKKVLIVFLGRTAAGPAFSLEVAKGFRENGFQVYVLLSEYILNKEDWLKESNIADIMFVKTYNGLFELFERTPIFYYKDIGKIKEHYKNIKFDIVLTTFFHPWNNVIWKQITAKHQLFICHDPYPHTGENRILSFLQIRQIRKSKEVIVLSKKFIKVMTDKYLFGKDNIYYMRHGKLGSYKDKQKNVKVYINSLGKINFLFFGRICEYKGIEVLIAAFQNVLKKHSNVSLTIAGNGDFSKYKEKLNDVSNVMVVNRYIEDEEVGSFFDDANVITVLPYITATQSGVIPIALEYGSPIIASNVGGLKEQLDDGKIGMFTNPNDVASLTDKMIEVIEKPEILIKQKSLMRDYFKKLEWKNIVFDLICSIEHNDK